MAYGKSRSEITVKKPKYRSVSGTIFDVLNIIFMAAVSITIIYPFLYIVAVSLTSNPVSISPFHPWPDKVVWANYSKVITAQNIVYGYINTIKRVVIGTCLTTFICMITAYPLSKKYIPFRTTITGFIILTMFFSGGLIPMYVLVRNLGMMNRVWALVIPILIPTFSMLILRNYFMTIPESLEESARLDGAGDFKILFKIVAPLSTPIIATIVLWTMVGHWNAWFDGLLYITDTKKQVLQTILRQILIVGTINDLINDAFLYHSPEGIKAATIIVATVPILMAYPFLQKYFIKGIMIGSLKG